jgi:ribosomal protein S18 acetylase RimI-like enzyme
VEPGSSGSPVSVRAAVAADAGWVRERLDAAWGSVLVARRGELLDASAFPALVAEQDGVPVGLLVLAVRAEECEVVSLTADVRGSGVGRALLLHCVEVARRAGCRRLTLTTTDNNVAAIAFYRRMGLTRVGFRPDGVAASRRVKPSIPLRDEHGVAIADEDDLELLL